MNNGRLNFWGKTKGFLGAPSNTFDDVAPETLITALQYFVIWAVVYALLQTILFYTVGRVALQTLWNLLGLSGPVLFSFSPGYSWSGSRARCLCQPFRKRVMGTPICPGFRWQERLREYYKSIRIRQYPALTVWLDSVCRNTVLGLGVDIRRNRHKATA